MVLHLGLGREVNFRMREVAVVVQLRGTSLVHDAAPCLLPRSVGKAADDMVKECMSQFPKIMSKEMEPQYNRCISISTEAYAYERSDSRVVCRLARFHKEVADSCRGSNL